MWRWYINITITILDIIHRPVLYLKLNVSETGFCLRLRVKLTQFGVITIFTNITIITISTTTITIIAIFPVVLFGSETWNITLREGHRLRVFENRILKGIFRPQRDEVMGGWRKLHNEEFSDLYSSPSIIRIIKSRRMRWARHVARMGRRGTHIGY
jgi:hypothetical protein